MKITMYQIIVYLSEINKIDFFKVCILIKSFNLLRPDFVIEVIL